MHRKKLVDVEHIFPKRGEIKNGETKPPPTVYGSPNQLNQLSLVVYPIICRALYIPCGSPDQTGISSCFEEKILQPFLPSPLRLHEFRTWIWMRNQEMLINIIPNHIIYLYIYIYTYHIPCLSYTLNLWLENPEFQLQIFIVELPGGIAFHFPADRFLGKESLFLRSIPMFCKEVIHETFWLLVTISYIHPISPFFRPKKHNAVLGISDSQKNLSPIPDLCLGNFLPRLL